MLKVLVLCSMLACTPQPDYSVEVYEDCTDFWFVNPATDAFNCLSYNYETKTVEWY